MTFSRLILALFVFPSAALAMKIDARTCAADLSSSTFERFVAEHGVRKALGPASFIAGDNKTAKLIDVRGGDSAAVAKAMMDYLGYAVDRTPIPHLENAITSALKVAREQNATFSISSWIIDGQRTVRISLDVSASQEPVLRLPELEILYGQSVRRVDLDISPARITLLTGTTQSVRLGRQILIGEAASHSLGLEIDAANVNAVVIDSFGHEAGLFIGPEAQPELRDLLGWTERIARKMFPASPMLQFREMDNIAAVSNGQGWQSRGPAH